MPAPPLRFIADALLSNKGDETGLVEKLWAGRLGPELSFLDLIEGRTFLRRGREHVRPRLEVTPGQIMSDLQLEMEVELAVSPLEFARRLRDIDRLAVEIFMEQRTLQGSKSVRSFHLTGSFESFREEAERQWSTDREEQLLQALTQPSRNTSAQSNR